MICKFGRLALLLTLGFSISSQLNAIIVAADIAEIGTIARIGSKP